MAILTNYEGSNDDYENGGQPNDRAQGFKIPSDSVVTSISIYGSRGSLSSGTTTFQIRQGTPGGTTLVSKQITSSTLTPYGSPQWNVIIFDSSIILYAGIQYYLVVAHIGSAADEMRWSTDTTSPSYANGSAWYLQSGTWNEVTARDRNFRIIGTVGIPTPPPTTNAILFGINF